jgi:valyl-tRNA synthetase
MPFISEEIWQKLPDTGEALINAKWPHSHPTWRDDDAERDMAVIMDVVTAARKLRAEQEVPPGQRVTITVASRSEQARRLLADNKEAALLLTRGSDLHISDDTEARPAVAEMIHCCGESTVVSISQEVTAEQLEQHRKRLLRRIAALEQEEERLRAKLRNGEFCRRAPAEVVEKTRAQHAKVHEETAELKAQLADLSQSLGK